MSTNTFTRLVATLAAVMCFGLWTDTVAAHAAPRHRVIGHPQKWASQWSFQQLAGFCALNSSTDLIAGAGGPELTQYAIEAWALANNELTPDGVAVPGQSTGWGMTWVQAVATIDYFGAGYGITAKGFDGGGLPWIEAALRANHELMVEVDGERIWRERKLDIGAPDHMAVVTGYDLTTRTVILNDSGTPYGRAERIPLARFLSAWNTSKELSVITNKADA